MNIFFVLLLLFAAAIGNGAENFTSFTEKDGGGDITVTSTKSDVTTMIRNTDSCVSEDYGAGNFTTFVHDIEAYYSFQDTYGLGGIYYVGDTDGCTVAVFNTIDHGFGSWFYNGRLYIRNAANGNEDYGAVSISTLYYLTYERTGSTQKCYIYSDSGRTSLVDTLEVTYDGAAYQYLGVTFSRESSAVPSDAISFYVQNLDLNEAATTPEVGYPQIIICE